MMRRSVNGVSMPDALLVDIDRCLGSDKLDGKTTDGLFVEVANVLERSPLFREVRFDFGAV